MKKSLLLVCMTALPVMAHAQLPSPYAGGSLGYTDTNSLDHLKYKGARVDDSDLGFKLFAGHRLNQHWAVEAAYTDLGKAKVSSGSGYAKVDSQSLSLSAMVMAPVAPDLDLFGKFGVQHWDADAHNSFGDSADDDGFDPVYGAGLNYSMGQLSLRAEYERYELGSADVDMASVGASWNF